MKRASRPKQSASGAKDVMGKKRGKISIPLNEIIDAVSRLGEKVKELDHGGQWRSEDSLWSQIATDLAYKLSIKNTLGVRKYIYTTWQRKSSKLRSHFISDTPKENMTTNNLQQLSSIPSYTTISTRSKTASSSDKVVDTNERREHLIEFSYEQWRQIYNKGNNSSNSHSMDASWTDVFYDKLVANKLVTCSLNFTKSKLRKKYSRKRNSPLFKCYAQCPRSGCPVVVCVTMVKPVLFGHNVVFRVIVRGIQRHEDPSKSDGRHLKGIKRLQMAQAAIEHGTLRTYEDNLLNADDNLLRCNNYTQVPSMDIIKTAVKEQNKAMRLDDNMFIELDMMYQSLNESDDLSQIRNKGYLQTLCLWPFSTTFYTEKQLIRFIEYCSSIKDSYIYVDATGSVVKALPNQKKPYLYLICFKDGQDSSNLLPLAGALMTDHTVATITAWLLLVRRGISAVQSGFIRPRYIIIDFSPALLNSILLAFNYTNINSYLRWCFNTIQKKYTSDQLHSMSCLRFCCAHVMHAFTRSLSKIKLDKYVRRKVIMIFGILLNCNEFHQIYDLIGYIIIIFGMPDLADAEENLDNVIKVVDDFNSDFGTFVEDEAINESQRLIEQELAELDDNFLSSEPILHQSPFTKLARERSPILSTLMDRKKTAIEKQIKNPLYSKELIRVFYKWIAYVPMFTGVMHNFADRYASDSYHAAKPNMFGSGRVSNATIESFFKILKHSILRHQTNLRPGEFLLKLYSTTNARLKAGIHNIQQSGSKKRRRCTKKELDATGLSERWKNGSKVAKRGAYFTNYKEYPLKASDIRNRLKEKLEIRRNLLFNDENNENMECESETEASCVGCPSTTQTIDTKQLSEPHKDSDENLQIISTVNDHQIQQSTPDDGRRKISSTKSIKHRNSNQSTQTTSKPNKCDSMKTSAMVEFDLPNQWPEYTEVNNIRLPFPHFNIAPTFFDGKRYSATNTCSLDSSLFLLYYIYISQSDNFRSLFDSKIPIYEQLRKTFVLVATEGWDIARLYWISNHTSHPGRNNLTQHHDLYGTADENVFQYVRQIQKYAIKSTCKSTNCPKSMRLTHSVDIAMPSLSGRSRRSIKVAAFSEQYDTKCGTTIGPDEPTHYNGLYSRDDLFPSSDGNGTRTMFICESDRVVSPHEFVNKRPPVLLLNVGQINLQIEDNKTSSPSVKDLPFLVFVGKERYCLAGAICTRPGHFTATIVYGKGRFSKYDDRCPTGVKDNEGGDDCVETAIYVIELND